MLEKKIGRKISFWRLCFETPDRKSKKASSGKAEVLISVATVIRDSAKIKVLSMKLDNSQRNITHLVEIASEGTSAFSTTLKIAEKKIITDYFETDLSDRAKSPGLVKL
jgi:hypothetical protein